MAIPKVFIIILNWNGKQDSVECLESLKKITYTNYEILLVDNGSTDESVRCFRERFPEIEIIENELNMGFAEGNNVGIRRAMEKGTDYVLLLNNDTVVDRKFLEELVNVAESEPRIGLAGPKVYYYDYKGRKDIIHSAGAKINMRQGTAPPIGINEVDIGQFDHERKVDYLEGACMLVKQAVIHNIGLMDAEYFAYWEETDWCIRARKAGYSIFYVPKAKIWHKVSASGSRPKRTYYLARNNFWFMKRHATREQYFSFLIYFFGYQFWITGGLFLYRKEIRVFNFFCKGIIDGIKRQYNIQQKKSLK